MQKLDEVDVVVIGFGGAGACAAIEAHDAGAKVLILEKAAEGGGNTLESGGTIRTLKDWKRAADHFEAITPTTPRDMLETFTKGIPRTIEWLSTSVRAKLDVAGMMHGYPPMPTGSAYPHLPGADALDIRVRVAAREVGEHGGKSLWDALHKATQTRGIDILYQSPAVDLVRDIQQGAVAGVVFKQGGRESIVHARRGVVLSCGGFESNGEMHRDFLADLTIPAFGPPGRNTGDGIRLAMGVGADLWHMNAIAGPFGYKFPEFEAAFIHLMPGLSYIYVDRDAERFVNETGVDFHACALAALAFNPVTAAYQRIPSFVIFDEETRLAGPISPGGGGWNRRFPWSSDNSREIQKGWIKKGETIAQVAEQLGISADRLTNTVRHYNSGCSVGVDDAFGRHREHLKGLQSAPFYGVELWPCLLNTQGGPRRNARAQVMGVTGKPIPRLYSAGELGSMWGLLYPGAANVTEALVFGRIAGANAAAESPLSATTVVSW